MGKIQYVINESSDCKRWSTQFSVCSSFSHNDLNIFELISKAIISFNLF